MAVYSVNTQVNLSCCIFWRATRSLGMWRDISLSKFRLRTCCWNSSKGRKLKENFRSGSGKVLKACIMSKHSLSFSFRQYTPFWAETRVMLENKTACTADHKHCFQCAHTVLMFGYSLTVWFAYKIHICLSTGWLRWIKTQWVFSLFDCTAIKRHLPRVNISLVWMTSMYQLFRLARLAT